MRIVMPKMLGLPKFVLPLSVPVKYYRQLPHNRSVIVAWGRVAKNYGVFVLSGNLTDMAIINVMGRKTAIKVAKTTWKHRKTYEQYFTKRRNRSFLDSITGGKIGGYGDV